MTQIEKATISMKTMVVLTFTICSVLITGFVKCYNILTDINDKFDNVTNRINVSDTRIDNMYADIEMLKGVVITYREAIRPEDDIKPRNYKRRR